MKRKLAFICGDQQDFGLIGCLESFSHSFEVFVYVLGDGKTALSEVSCNVTIFNSLEDMPGYMRDLELHLPEVDVVACFETTRLSSYQALKISQKRNIPFCVFASEVKPYQFIEFPNIQAIHADVTAGANLIVATSDLARDKLAVEGIDVNKVKVCVLGSNPLVYKPSSPGREKFRRYIGIGEDDIVLLYRDDLVASNRPLEVLNLVKALLTRCLDLGSRLKVIICGTGDESENLKYLASDLGLGKNTLFLHQKIEKFAPDLFAASDFCLVTRKTDPTTIESSFRWLMDAISCGVIPVVPNGEVSAELAGPLAVKYEGASLVFALDALGKLVDTEDYLEFSLRVSDWARDNVDSRVLIPEVCKALTVESDRFRQEFVEDWGVLERCSQLLAAKKFREVLDLIDDEVGAEEVLPMAIVVRARVLRGECHLGTFNYERAIESFSRALELEPNNSRGLIGLGNVSLQSQSWGEAISFFKRVTQLGERLGDAYLGLGMSYAGSGREREAYYWYYQCLAGYETGELAKSAIIQLALSSSDLRWGVDILEDLHETEAEEPRLAIALGNLYIKNGRHAEGRELLQLASKFAST